MPIADHAEDQLPDLIENAELIESQQPLEIDDQPRTTQARISSILELASFDNEPEAGEYDEFDVEPLDALWCTEGYAKAQRTDAERIVYFSAP